MSSETSKLPEPVDMSAEELVEAFMLARDRLNGLLRVAKRKDIVVNYNIDVNGFVRILLMKSTITYYDYEKRKEESEVS